MWKYIYIYRNTYYILTILQTFLGHVILKRYALETGVVFHYAGLRETAAFTYHLLYLFKTRRVPPFRSSLLAPNKLPKCKFYIFIKIIKLFILLNYEYLCLITFFSVTLYLVHSKVSGRNLVLRHSVPHFPPNSGSIAC